MKLLIDSSAWIDYFDGGGVGDEVSQLLKGNNEIFLFSLIIAEVASRFARMGKDVDQSFRIMSSHSSFFHLSGDVALEAGFLHAEMKKKRKNFGLADAFIVVAARSLGAKIVTKDDHFKGFKEAILLR
tara:strand:+ start:313 stop:696 length:384 start_codon:yes stop_codon:yes gene_type:complete